MRDSLKTIFHNKCVYCECIENKPEIEHYRPKKGVSEDPAHQGYFWLCYEWTNLLPSCRYCNTEGGKGNKFQISGNRVFSAPIEGTLFNTDRCKLTSNELVGESPMLLNPEIDNVEYCFSFKINGEMIGIDVPGRGKYTINTCNLNRDNLLFKRQKVIDDHLGNINDILKDYLSTDDNIDLAIDQIKRKLSRLKLKCCPSSEFSLINYNILYNYEDFIIIQLETNAQKDFVRDVYEEFMDKNPD